MTVWDLRAFGRGLGATLVALAVVWLVTAASDEGQLTVATRTGRTLPVAPLCSAIGAALALGTARLRDEARALEALGRSPGQVTRAAALGAALPSLVIAALIAISPRVDVDAFYPRAPRADPVAWDGEAFTSAALGVRIDADGEARPVPLLAPSPDEGLVPGGRPSAAAATALAGVALALLGGRAVLTPSLSDDARARRSRVVASALGLGCAVLMLLAFQAAAAHLAPAAAAAAVPALVLVVLVFGYRGRDEALRG